MVETHPALPPASPPWAITTSAPAAIACSAAATSPTVCSHLMPWSCACWIRSAGIPMWKEIAAGPNASVAAKASGSKGRPVWLIAKGRSVRSRSSAHWARNSGTVRTAVPRLPNPPAWHTAAARST
jgi:hypothetical protein